MGEGGFFAFFVKLQFLFPFSNSYFLFFVALYFTSPQDAPIELFPVITIAAFTLIVNRLYLTYLIVTKTSIIFRSQTQTGVCWQEWI